MSSDTNVLIHPTAHRLKRCKRLARVLRITKQMMTAINKADWEEVSRLEQIRQPDFAKCFDQPLESEESEALSEGLAVLVCLNEDLMDRLKEELLSRRYPLHEVSTPKISRSDQSVL